MVELLTQDAVLRREAIDDAVLTSVHPPGERQQEEVQWVTGSIERHGHQLVVVEQRRPAKPPAVGSPQESVAADNDMGRVPGHHEPYRYHECIVVEAKVGAPSVGTAGLRNTADRYLQVLAFRV